MKSSIIKNNIFTDILAKSNFLIGPKRIRNLNR